MLLWATAFLIMDAHTMILNCYSMGSFQMQSSFNALVQCQSTLHFDHKGSVQWSDGHTRSFCLLATCPVVPPPESALYTVPMDIAICGMEKST